jgi:hypothetical protein
MSATHRANAGDVDIVASQLMKLMPIALGGVAFGWAILASLIPSMTLRIVAWVTIGGVIAYLYLTTAGRIVVTDDAVELELMRKRTRIPYASIDHVTVRASPLGGAIRVRFDMKGSPAVIRTRIGLMRDEVLELAPQLIEALLAHGVDVRVPGRPDVRNG